MKDNWLNLVKINEFFQYVLEAFIIQKQYRPKTLHLKGQSKH